MPRGASPKFEVVSSPVKSATAVIAAAKNYTGKVPTTGERPIIPEAWQELAWRFYDEVGEYRYSVNWVGNLLSRAKLHVLENGKPTKNAVALELLEALFNGPEGQSEMLRQLGVHFTVAGDCYLVGMNTGEDEQDDWLVGAASATRRDSVDGTWRVDVEEVPANSLIIRLWRPHPRVRRFSDSPTRAVLPILSEIDGLTKHVAAQVDSRLAGAGILFIPNEMSFGAPPSSEPGDDDDDIPSPTSSPDELARVLAEVMSTAIEHRQDASALVPIVVQGPGEWLDKVKWLTFATPLDQQAVELRTEAIRRLALGMDMPPEILTGTSDMNHWSSWQVEEAAIKAHTEPLLGVICNSITEGYLRPMLKKAGEDETTFMLGADTTQLRLRPNRSKESQELYDRGLLSAEATIRENGFDPDADIMDPKELVTFILRKMAAGSTTPNLVLAAAEALGVSLNVTPENIRVTETERVIADPTQATPDPSLQGHPEQGPPDPSQSEAEGALNAAAAVMVYRALERAGNKMKSRLAGTLPGVRASDMYRHVKLDFARAPIDDLLDDAWSTCETFAPSLGVSTGWLTNALDTYTRGLLQFQKPFTAISLRDHLRVCAKTHPELLSGE